MGVTEVIGVTSAEESFPRIARVLGGDDKNDYYDIRLKAWRLPTLNGMRKLAHRRMWGLNRRLIHGDPAAFHVQPKVTFHPVVLTLDIHHHRGRQTQGRCAMPSRSRARSLRVSTSRGNDAGRFGAKRDRI